jgi:hypothetical protein
MSEKLILRMICLHTPQNAESAQMLLEFLLSFAY